ncbi:MAG: phytoene desaturase family protein [Muribaculaceae bacterium]
MPTIESAVIIGGGLGGLVCGALLAKEGIKVTIVEKNSVAGGGLMSFSRFGRVFDTGMHVVGGLNCGWNMHRLFSYLGVIDSFGVQPMPLDCTDSIYVAEDASTYNIAASPEGFINSLSQYFPHQRANLESYVDAIGRIASQMPFFFLRSVSEQPGEYCDDFNMPAECFIAKYITDRKLRAVLSYINMFYAGRASCTPAYQHAIISTIYLGGQARFVDGSHHLAQALSDVATSNGGAVVTGQSVERIITGDGRITAVETADGSRYEADCFVSDIAPDALLGMLDNPRMLPKAYRKRVGALKHSGSAFTLNIALRKSSFAYLPYTGYFMERYGDVWNHGHADNWPSGFLYMTPPVENQGQWADKMIVTVPMEWSMVEKWEGTTVGHRGDDYRQWKRQCADAVLDRLETVFPGFGNSVEAIDTASPLTIRDYLGYTHGSMTGFMKDCNSPFMSMMSTRTKVPNLFLTGQNIYLHGFCGVSLTAIRTCEAILGMDTIINKLNRYE